MNLNLIKYSFFRNLLIFGFVLTIMGCKKDVQDIGATGEGEAKLVFTVKGMNNEFTKVNSKISSTTNSSNENIESHDIQVDALSTKVNLFSQSTIGTRESSTEVPTISVKKNNVTKFASIVPVDHDIRYRLLLFDSETNSLVANVETKVNQALSINVKTGKSYYWRAYTHNSKEAMPSVNFINDNYMLESSIEKDLLWDGSTAPITVNTPADSLGIVFDFKVAEFVVNLDTEGLYGDISDLLMEFGSDSYFKKGTLDLKSGNVSNTSTVLRSELNLSDFKVIPESKILQAKFYTVDPNAITNFTIKVKKLSVNQNNIVKDLHKITDPAKDVNFLFNPSMNKSHVASMAFRYRIPVKTILHVTKEEAPDTDYSYAAQPTGVFGINTVWNASSHRQSFNLIKSPNNFGTQLNSKVHTDGFKHIRCFDDGTLDDKLLLKPDIVIISRYNLDTDDITGLINYLNNGGVVIMMSDLNMTGMDKVQSFMNSLFARNNIVPKNNINGYGSLLKINHTGTINDMIVNGPFGNLEGKYWGNDAHHVTHLDNLPLGLGSNEATTYSNPQADNVAPEDRSTSSPSMFKHNSKSLFWIGNSTFLRSQAKTSSGISVNVQNEWGNYPFAISETFEPISKKYGYNLGSFRDVVFNKGIDYNSEVDNSALFGNLMTWALYQSEFFGINSTSN